MLKQKLLHGRNLLAGEGTKGYWKGLEKEQSYNFIIERFSSVIIIGHHFYGMGLYAIPQNSAEPIFIGGIDVRQVNGVSISIDSNTGKATIKNGNIVSVYYRFL